MKRLLVALFGLTVAVALAIPAAISSNDNRTVAEFDVMAPVQEPFTGSVNPIRGLNGGGLPWEIDKGKGELRADGRLKVDVEGLVLARRAPVPPNLQGTNPITEFKAIVSCLTATGGTAQTANVSTGTVPATATGDARIDTTLTLPSPCFAPIVFVTSPGGAWFAVTGR